MADPLLYEVVVATEMMKMMETLRGLLAETPGADELVSDSEHTPYLHFTPLQMLEAATVDNNIRNSHGASIFATALARVIAEQGERIAALEGAAPARGLRGA